LQKNKDTKNDEENSDRIKYRTPLITDGDAIYELIKKSPPLDLNSRYYYLIFCSHFKETSIVASEKSKIIGFISGYFIPSEKNTFFIWQVAVDKSCRGKNIGKNMIKVLLNKETRRKADFLETTVSPSNKASEALFTSVANEYKTAIEKSVLFEKSLFGKEPHEGEVLFRIGPLNK
jgi:L-2,4-diaminobutyric acid acetyltransferase